MLDVSQVHLEQPIIVIINNVFRTSERIYICIYKHDNALSRKANIHTSTPNSYIIIIATEIMLVKINFIPLIYDYFPGLNISNIC